MYDLTPILGFAATNGELKKRLRDANYGKVEDHLDALNKYKMWMPEVLQDSQQVHLGLLMAQLLEAQNNPTRIQHIKELVNSKWLVKHPMYSHKSIPKTDTYSRGTIFNLVVGCSRDPYYEGNLLDNPRCAGMFRDDVIERVHHKTMPIYMDKHGNIKVFFEGSTDTCNIFTEDGSLEIPQASLDYLFKKRGVKTAIISKSGTKGFEKTDIFQLADRVKGENSSTWLLLALFALVIICVIAFYLSYVTNTVNNRSYGLKEPRQQEFVGGEMLASRQI